LDNCREGDALRFNKPKPLFPRETNINFRVFDEHLKQRGITDAYSQCGVKITKKNETQ